MKLPVNDWQFWVATLLALMSLLYILRNVLPRGISPFHSRRGEKAATLTVKGKTVKRK